MGLMVGSVSWFPPPERRAERPRRAADTCPPWGGHGDEIPERGLAGLALPRAPRRRAAGPIALTVLWRYNLQRFNSLTIQ